MSVKDVLAAGKQGQLCFGRPCSLCKNGGNTVPPEEELRGGMAGTWFAICDRVEKRTWMAAIALCSATFGGSKALSLKREAPAFLDLGAKLRDKRLCHSAGMRHSHLLHTEAKPSDSWDAVIKVR